jgi:hypothetical protein
MPRTPKDYSKCAFYRLVCRDITVAECYVGHTTNIVDRRYSHKTRCTNKNDPNFNCFVYRFIRDHGSWDNWQLLVIEQFAVADGIAAALRERHWTEHYNATLNSQVPGQTKAEYRAEHRDEEIQRHAAWKAAHKVHLKTQHDCACGGKYTTEHQSRHFKSKRHVAYLAALPAA